MAREFQVGEFVRIIALDDYCGQIGQVIRVFQATCHVKVTGVARIYLRSELLPARVRLIRVRNSRPIPNVKLMPWAIHQLAKDLEHQGLMVSRTHYGLHTAPAYDIEVSYYPVGRCIQEMVLQHIR
ncbi:hypothetical protein ACOJUR_15365 [Alicyclobacillus tolerans]|uniref:hypothetical protein n=1 Tax=Alicyclobacillus tolerans TaxID=90970 RepID=UPI003B7EA853